MGAKTRRARLGSATPLLGHERARIDVDVRDLAAGERGPQATSTMSPPPRRQRGPMIRAIEAASYSVASTSAAAVSLIPVAMANGAYSPSGGLGLKPHAAVLVDGRDREVRGALELGRVVGLVGNRQHEAAVHDDGMPVAKSKDCAVLGVTLDASVCVGLSGGDGAVPGVAAGVVAWAERGGRRAARRAAPGRP